MLKKICIIALLAASIFTMHGMAVPVNNPIHIKDVINKQLQQLIFSIINDFKRQAPLYQVLLPLYFNPNGNAQRPVMDLLVIYNCLKNSDNTSVRAIAPQFEALVNFAEYLNALKAIIVSFNNNVQSILEDYDSDNIKEVQNEFLNLIASYHEKETDELIGKEEALNNYEQQLEAAIKNIFDPSRY